MDDEAGYAFPYASAFALSLFFKRNFFGSNPFFHRHRREYDMNVEILYALSKIIC